jgi:hypothetical protein
MAGRLWGLPFAKPVLVVLIGLPLLAGVALLSRRSRQIRWAVACVVVAIHAAASSLWFLVHPDVEERRRLREKRSDPDA